MNQHRYRDANRKHPNVCASHRRALVAGFLANARPGNAIQVRRGSSPPRALGMPCARYRPRSAPEARTEESGGSGASPAPPAAGDPHSAPGAVVSQDGRGSAQGMGASGDTLAMAARDRGFPKPRATLSARPAA
jgi:hypothetical protein